MTNVELVIVYTKADLGEGPYWDADQQKLYWVDIERAQLHVHDPQGAADAVFDVGCKVGAAVLRQSGSVLLATHHGFEDFDLQSREKASVADPESHLPDNRFNDGKCDSRGRFWAGTMSMVRQPAAGSLYVLDTDGSVHRKFGGVTTSNGLGWSPDDSTMYYIDTPTLQVAAFDFDAETGTIDNRRVIVTFPDGVGRPDGMTVDAEGMLWIAHWDGGRITRWNPDGGQLIQTVELPVQRVTSCTFGGPDLRQLFITTARHGLDQAALKDQPLAGALFVLDPGVRGLPTYRYAG
jgi:sugar lactone lactonase YvrE